MLLKVEKGIRDVICQSIHWFAKANNYYIRDYNYDKESTYLVYWNVSSLYRWTLLRKLSVEDFGWRKDIFTFDEGFIKTYDENIDKLYIIEV